jgi:hypothetical protein
MCAKFYIVDCANREDVCVKRVEHVFGGCDATGKWHDGYKRPATLQEIMAWYDERNEHLTEKCLEAERELMKHKTEFTEFLQAEVAKRETKQ